MRLTPVAVAIALTLSAGLLAQSTPGIGTNGRIEGRVLTPYAELVAGAIVTLHPSSGMVARQLAITTTDNEGRFSLEGVAPGQYRLSAQKTGYTSRRYPSGVPLESTAGDAALDDLLDVAHPVSVGADQTVADLTITMHRTARIAGRIIGPDGAAAPGITVAAALQVDGRRPRPLLGTLTRSAADGRYAIEGLPPGEYLVMTQPLPFQPPANADGAGRREGRESVSMPILPSGRAGYEATVYPGVADTEPGTLLQVLEGVPVEGIDIWLRPAERFNVSGRIYWPVNTAPENLTIEYGDAVDTRSRVWYVSDPGGLFTLLGVPPGPLTLLARGETGQGPLLGLATTDVSVDAVQDVEITIDRPSAVTGRVRVDGAAAPPAGLVVTLTQRLLRVSPLHPTTEGAVDSGGRFEVTGLLGEYEIGVRGPGSVPRVARVVRNGITLPSNRIRVGGGEVVTGLDVVLAQ